MRGALAHRHLSIAVVTTGTETGSRSLVMSKGCCRRYPHIGAMAGFTYITGNRVSGGLKGTRTHPIMTSAAVTGLPCYGSVIEGHAQPGHRTVAHIASRCGGHMGRAHTLCHSIVMTVGAGVRGLGMVER